MTMVLVKDGKVVIDYLPSSYELDGETVANFHLLDRQLLMNDGWVPIIDNIPDYDDSTHTLVVEGYSINKYNVVKKYKVVEKKKSVEESMGERLEATEIALMELLMEG